MLTCERLCPSHRAPRLPAEVTPYARTSCAFPPGAATIILINSSVIRGSNPSVCPLSNRTTSAITRPSRAFG